MIIKVIEDLYKTKMLEGPDGEKIPTDVPYKEVVKKMEISEVNDFCELLSPVTNKPYKNKCLLSSPDGYLKVKHSFKELLDLKQSQQRIIIRGFYASKPTTRSR
jgi:hypothetical protein